MAFLTIEALGRRSAAEGNGFRHVSAVSALSALPWVAWVATALLHNCSTRGCLD